MQFSTILIQLLLVLETIIIINGLFYSKTKKYDHHLIAAKYNPEMPKRVREILEKIGDNSIIKIQLGRTPVVAVLILFLNLISSWKFYEKQLELGYDEIYHNYLLITIQNRKGWNALQKMISTSKDTTDSTVYKFEKAHRVRLMKPVFPTEFTDIYDIPLTPNKTFTLNRLITTASNVDKHFYSYDAGNNNMCQTFVENIVDINGLTQNIIDDSTRTALKPQDAKALVATLGSRRDIVKHITDLGGKLDKWVYDHKIKWKQPPIKEFTLYGHMHVKIADDAINGNISDIIESNGDAVIVKGATDIVVENGDEIFNAVVALEEDDIKQRSQKTAIIVGIIIVVILLISVAAIIAFLIWQKRKDKLKKNELNNNVIDKTKRDSNISEITHTTNN